MTSVDYNQIAARYDRSPIRHQIPRDRHLGAVLGRQPKVLDLACGTGLYLAEQVRKRPDRFQALAALPLQDPDLAARVFLSPIFSKHSATN